MDQRVNTDVKEIFDILEGLFDRVRSGKYHNGNIEKEIVNIRSRESQPVGSI